MGIVLGIVLEELMLFVSRSLLLIAGAVAGLGLHALPAFAQAPKQLYNKTIQINWTVTVVRDGGQTLPMAVGHTVYVSSAGRVFQRGSRSGKKGQKQHDLAPGATSNADGEARGITFSGGKLVGQVAFAQGARQFVATFDPGFSSCTVAVVFGRDSGGMKRVGIDGKMHTIEKITASGESCSIREGNPFAN